MLGKTDRDGELSMLFLSVQSYRSLSVFVLTGLVIVFIFTLNAININGWQPHIVIMSAMVWALLAACGYLDLRWYNERMEMVTERITAINNALDVQVKVVEKGDPAKSTKWAKAHEALSSEPYIMRETEPGFYGEGEKDQPNRAAIVKGVAIGLM